MYIPHYNGRQTLAMRSLSDEARNHVQGILDRTNYLESPTRGVYEEIYSYAFGASTANGFNFPAVLDRPYEDVIFESVRDREEGRPHAKFLKGLDKLPIGTTLGG